MQTWRDAMDAALYGPSGFYRTATPEQHFRTSVSASPRFAECDAALIVRVDESLGRPDPFDVVDVGAGDGTLLDRLAEALPRHLMMRARLTAVELRMPATPTRTGITWQPEVPDGVTGMLMAHELLDNVPCQVVELTSGQVHVVRVDSSGNESVSEAASEQTRDWVGSWWPLAHEGDRAECGAERDQAWQRVVASLDRGTALAVDYGHLLEERRRGEYPVGTLTGYRQGRQVRPVPDGSCDITAHVAMDACADAGSRAGADATLLLRQRHALRGLGLDVSVPDHAIAVSDPPGYVDQLSSASAAAELLDRGSLGSFLWLLQSKGMPLPTLGSVGSGSTGTDTLSG